MAFTAFGFVATAFGFTATANKPGRHGRHESVESEAPAYIPPTTNRDEDQTTPDQRQPIPGTTLPDLHVER